MGVLRDEIRKILLILLDVKMAQWWGFFVSFFKTCPYLLEICTTCFICKTAYLKFALKYLRKKMYVEGGRWNKTGEILIIKMSDGHMKDYTIHYIFYV